MEMKLKSCFFSLAVLAAVAARADGPASSAGDEDSAYHASGAGQAEESAAADPSRSHKDDAAPRGAQQAMGDADAGALGSGSGEPARRAEARWNEQEFLRNVWTAP